MSSPYNAESLATVPEPELVRRLLADPHWRDRILRIHGIPENVNDYPEVIHDELGKSGDIDILVVDPTRPQFATGVQVKRVKVSAGAFQTGMPNRLTAIAKLHRQASLLVHLGFWQVFSYALVVVDSRELNQGKYAFDGLTRELRATIDGAITTTGLHTNAGFIQFELTQPMDDSPLGTGTFFSKIHRMPTVQPQPDGITTWVARVVAERDTSQETPSK